MLRMLAILLLTLLFQTQIEMIGSQIIDGSNVATTALPIGTITLFAGDVIPKDWLLCNGTAISRLSYFSLFLVIGTLYGSGDYVRTYNLPDFRGRFPLGLDARLSQRSGFNQGGATEIRLSEAELPIHTHDVSQLSTTNEGGHVHAVQDPGHNHGGVTSDGPMGGSGRGMVNGGGSHDYSRHTHTIPMGYTGIALSQSGSHTHTITGSLRSTGQGRAFSVMNPFQRINYIIYAGPELPFPSIG